MSIGERIRSARNDDHLPKKISQKELGKAVGYNYHTIQRIEADEVCGLWRKSSSWPRTFFAFKEEDNS